ncbi:hypothetical protein ABIC28_005046 [Rhodococcus sp. PvR044]|uniref:Uncharacterized protein n=1 Tax=Rhodococcus maanshanensis TaxID=183556 RepID=A0A1H7NXB6_9NOCA|nr:hypothetical protein [Rhodococcus sp. PvR099]PTR36461.1 hypothetical protein C8K38_12455 [Rhodococcus sp. OK611]SEL28250.1 hypothetical protein SAMN05444583_107182 [Rhodococcus maanshanensis]SNX93948.1 hypothetical protein SAMN05447004_12555 [Rhodococcus sp. OK270]
MYHGASSCQNGTVANNSSKRYVDPGWPAPELQDGDHAVTELSSSRSGGLSPFGEDTEFPLPVSELPYTHPHTVINR